MIRTLNQVRSALLVSDRWSDEDFTRAFTSLKAHNTVIDSKTLNLPELKRFLRAHNSFLLTLFENPQIIEHEGFTPLLQAVFHLSEELAARDQLTDLPASDYVHLSGDINRIYGLLIMEWLTYMRHLKKHYPVPVLPCNADKPVRCACIGDSAVMYQAPPFISFFGTSGFKVAGNNSLFNVQSRKKDEL